MRWRWGLVLAAFASSALAGLDHERIRDLRAAGEILPLETILEHYRSTYPDGRILETELEQEDGVLVYELYILGDDGEVRELEYDARSGVLLRVKSATEKHGGRRRSGWGDD
ncbi:MAG TPA: PepSY domain-containing protein [Candidatus Competibacteraceae bacterium]|nr:PepSY domain-containing protein [Candidatus Competibacteraceae bacterium]